MHFDWTLLYRNALFYPFQNECKNKSIIFSQDGKKKRLPYLYILLYIFICQLPPCLHFNVLRKRVTDFTYWTVREGKNGELSMKNYYIANDSGNQQQKIHNQKWMIAKMRLLTWPSDLTVEICCTIYLIVMIMMVTADHFSLIIIVIQIPNVSVQKLHFEFKKCEWRKQRVREHSQYWGKWTQH